MIKFRHFLYGVAFTSAVAMPVQPLHAQSNSAYELSMESAIMYALNDNPDIGMSLEQRRQQEFASQRAKSIFYPQVTANLVYGPEYNDPAALNAAQGTSTTPKSETAPSTDMSLVVNQFIFDGFSSQNELKRQRQLEQSAKITEAITTNDIISDTIENYLDVLAYQNLNAQSADYVSRIAEIFELVSLQTEAGAENFAKKNYIESRLSYAQSQQENNASAYKDAVTNLKFLVGDMPDFTVYQPDLLQLVNKDINDYVTKALKDNNQIRLQDSDIQSVEYASKREKGTLYPTINLIAEAAKTNDVGGNIGEKYFAAAQVQVNYKLFDGFARDAAIESSKSRELELYHQKRKEEKEVKQRIELFYNQIIALKNDLVITEQEIDSSQKLQELSQQQFELGDGDLITLVEGEERLYAAETKKTQLQSQLILNMYRLIREAGLLNKDLFCATC